MIYGRVRDTEAMKRSVEEVIVLGAEQAALDEGAAVGEGSPSAATSPTDPPTT